MEPLDLPPDRFCNLAWHWMTRGTSPDKTAELAALVNQPPGGSASDQVRAAVGPWSRDAELAEFRRA